MSGVILYSWRCLHSVASASNLVTNETFGKSGELQGEDNHIIALLLAIVSGLTAQDQQPQTEKNKQPQPPKPELIVTGEYTEWREGPDGSSARTGVTAPDGSSLTISTMVISRETGSRNS